MLTSTPRHQFLETYAKIRAAEGRGSDDSAYYRAAALRRIPPNGASARAPSSISSAGFFPAPPATFWTSARETAGSRIALPNWATRPWRVDIFADPRDGLSAARHYPVDFPVIESGFDDLPFPAARFDLAVFNSSIHYSSDYVRTLSEARRCLRPGGRVVILDSPVYERREHGEAMRAERQTSFERQYGFRSEALGSVEFFDLDMLKDLARQLSLTWEIHRPWYGWRWHLRPVRARLKGQRPPSRFWILVGKFQ